MTLSDDEKKELVRVRLDAALESLADARRAAGANSFRGAMNRAYYAMFHAASALAISRGEVHKKHTHLIAFFQKEFAKPGIFDRRHGRALQKAFEDRSEADYQDFVTFDKQQVDLRVKEAGEFVDAISSRLQRSQNG